MSSGPADVLRDANRLLHDGDPVEAVQRLRGAVVELPVEEVVRIVGEAATALGLTALADSARKVTRRPRSAEALYGFGYECVEEGGLAFAAVPALTAALRRRPRDTSILVELVCALQRVDRNAAAVEVLERHGAPTRSWPTGEVLVEYATAGPPRRRSPRTSPCCWSSRSGHRGRSGSRWNRRGAAGCRRTRGTPR
jgi:hypothetical protein